MNTQNQTHEAGERAQVRYAGKCYGQNRHWHLSMNGRWTYHNDIKCQDCQTADTKYSINQP